MTYAIIKIAGLKIFGLGFYFFSLWVIASKVVNLLSGLGVCHQFFLFTLIIVEAAVQRKPFLYVHRHFSFKKHDCDLLFAWHSILRGEVNLQQDILSRLWRLGYNVEPDLEIKNMRLN